MSEISFWNAVTLAVKSGDFTYDSLCKIVDENIPDITVQHLIKTTFKAILDSFVKEEPEPTTDNESKENEPATYTHYSCPYTNEMTELLLNNDSVSFVEDIVPMLTRAFEQHTKFNRTPVALDDYLMQGVLAAGDAIYAYPRIELGGKGPSLKLKDFVYKHR